MEQKRKLILNKIENDEEDWIEGQPTRPETPMRLVPSSKIL